MELTEGHPTPRRHSRGTAKPEAVARCASIFPKQEKQKISALQGIDFNDRMAQFSITLDVRGKRGEEVFVILDRYMNDALLLGSNEIKILHGKGDGILRNLVREQLKRYSQIKSFEDEHADRGGAGVTIVTFK